jgi:hypothetical protein
LIERRFLATERRWYEVTDAFPRIVPASFEEGSIPTGVTSIEYLVDLDAVSELCDQNVVLDRLGADL